MTTDVTFRLAGGAQPLILIPVSVNGSEAQEFVLDTGAGTTLLTTVMAARAGIQPTGTKEGAGAAGRVVVQTGQAEKITVGTLSAWDVPVAITDELQRIGEAIGASVHGAIGHSFLKGLRITIDYRGGRLRLEDAPATPDSRGVPLRLAHPSKPLALVSAQVNGEGPFTFADDTGASITVISPELARRLGIESTSAPSMTGGGGAISSTSGTIGSLMIGRAVGRRLSVMIADFLNALSSAVGTPLDGVVGYNFLRGFTVSIDYPNSVLGLEIEAPEAPSPSGETPDRTGRAERG